MYEKKYDYLLRLFIDGGIDGKTSVCINCTPSIVKQSITLLVISL
jgi:hypothetical protein